MSYRRVATHGVCRRRTLRMPLTSTHVVTLNEDCWSNIISLTDQRKLLAIASTSHGMQRLVRKQLPRIHNPPLAIYSHREHTKSVFTAIGCRLGNQYIIDRHRRTYSTNFDIDKFDDFTASLTERHFVVLVCALAGRGY
jgi:hypothetical protein